MNIEIVEAYPMEKENTFSMHVYLPAEDIDIRGVHVVFRKKWLFMMPNKANWDDDSNKNVSFPCIGFVNPEKQNDFMKSLTEKGTSFMQDRINEIMNKRRVKPAKSDKKPKKI